MQKFFHRINWLLVTAAAAVMLPLFSFVSCCPRVYPVERTDSVRVEIRERVIHDSVPFAVPLVKEVQVVRDTISHLANEWAESDALVDSLGFLHHSLATKPHTVYVPYTVEVHDTTTIEKATETIIRETNVLTKRQQIWMRIGKVSTALMTLLMLGLVAYVALRAYLKFTTGR